MNKRNLVIAGVVLVVLAIIASMTLFTVNQAQQALVLQFGEPIRVINTPGLKAKLPFVQNVIYFERRILNLDPPVERVILADQKPLLVDAFARYRITDPLKFFQTVQNEATLRSRLGPIVTASVRGVLGNATLSNVLSEERRSLMDELHREVNTDASRFGIEIVDVRIRRADLPEETSQAVYARMRTEREREASEFRAQGFERAQQIRSGADREATVIRAEATKQADILRGQGEGEATRIYNKAFSQDPQFFEFYRAMSAYREALSEETTYILSPSNEFLRRFGNSDGR
jgi:modulator of FtsH protease HflC